MGSDHLGSDHLGSDHSGSDHSGSDPKWSDPKWSDPKWSDPKWSDPKWSHPRLTPPRLAAALVHLAVRPPLAEHLLGDLEEQFHANVERLGLRRARRRYWRQALATVWFRPSSHSQPVDPRHKELPMSALLLDLRFAARLLIRRPSYAAIAILSLSLAIGANGVVYGLVNALLLNPFDFPESARLISQSARPTRSSARTRTSSSSTRPPMSRTSHRHDRSIASARSISGTACCRTARSPIACSPR